MPGHTKRKQAQRKPKGRRKVARVMREFKRGALRSGSGKKVTSRKQAQAIALSEQRRVERQRRRRRR